MRFSLPGTMVQDTRFQVPFSTGREPVQVVQSQKTGDYFVLANSPKPDNALVAVPIKVALPVTSPIAKQFTTTDGDTLSMVSLPRFP